MVRRVYRRSPYMARSVHERVPLPWQDRVYRKHALHTVSQEAATSFRACGVSRVACTRHIVPRNVAGASLLFMSPLRNVSFLIGFPPPLRRPPWAYYRFPDSRVGCTVRRTPYTYRQLACVCVRLCAVSLPARGECATRDRRCRRRRPPCSHVNRLGVLATLRECVRTYNMMALA
jgi:hypothetical protein